MSNPLSVPAAIKWMSFLLPVLALLQLALAVLLIFNGVLGFGMSGNPAAYIGITLGLVMIVSALVAIVAIFTLRRRSRAMRIAMTVSSLITIGIAITVLIEVLITYGGRGSGDLALALTYYLPPLLVVLGLPLAVLIMLWAASSTRVFFKVSPPQV